MNMMEITRSTFGLMIKRLAFELLIVEVGYPIKSTLQDSFSSVFYLFTLSLKTWSRAPFLLLDLGILRVFDCVVAPDKDFSPSLRMNLGVSYPPVRFSCFALLISFINNIKII